FLLRSLAIIKLFFPCDPQARQAASLEFSQIACAWHLAHRFKGEGYALQDTQLLIKRVLLAFLTNFFRQIGQYFGWRRSFDSDTSLFLGRGR
ncbi:MAG: hypothetical protein MUD14_13600, partial [Hydrococcus sp. Prado102]|nr:hypothetical protein [Hydrococcus sp. Prado102]